VEGQVELRKHSWLYQTLSSKSERLSAKVFKWSTSALIVVNCIAYVMSTMPKLDKKYGLVFDYIEACSAVVFMVEYVSRLYVCTEKPKYSKPISGRIRYAMKLRMIIDAISTFPTFLIFFIKRDVQTLAFLRMFRLFQLLKADASVAAFDSVLKVLYYNRQILLVAFIVCFLLMLFTSVLLYTFRPPLDLINDEADFESLPATMYLSLMMLTGQGQPEGELPWYTKGIIVITSLVSVAQFAIPASMLTWGFEAEAERLATKARAKRKRAKQAQEAGEKLSESNTTASSSITSDGIVSTNSSWEEYEALIGGDEGDSEGGGDAATPRAAQPVMSEGLQARMERFFDSIEGRVAEGEASNREVAKEVRKAVENPAVMEVMNRLDAQQRQLDEISVQLKALVEAVGKKD